MTTRRKYTTPIVIHPGETLKEWLEENGMTSAEFALRSGEPPKTISQIINGKSGIVPETAEAFSIVTGIPSNFWLKLQALYNESIVRLKAEPLLQRLWDVSSIKIWCSKKQ